MVRIEGCTLTVIQSKVNRGSADVVMEKNGEEILRIPEDYLWLLRFGSPDLGEYICSELFRSKKISSPTPAKRRAAKRIREGSDGHR